ncbi:MAG TPA: ribonuclease P protein component [Terrimesophilobacter sp.]|uniref:ribonuclease P protein component n=1 Tax=Terrimesophilobacter sp. TaxID=2906435 RepID=UPI002F946A89
MLARANRLVSADDYRTVLRRGSRRASLNTVVSVVRTVAGSPARFGFIVTRKVGNAVKRNRVRRRMKAIAWELINGGLTGTDVVVRALPASVEADWVTLHSEITEALERSRNT